MINLADLTDKAGHRLGRTNGIGFLSWLDPEVPAVWSFDD